MSLESCIKGALSSFGYEVCANTYGGDDDIYFTFNYNTYGEDHGDNKPQHEIALIQVHFFCPNDFYSVATRKIIKKKLYQAGFGYAEMTDSSDKNGQHLVFEVDAVERVDVT